MLVRYQEIRPLLSELGDKDVYYLTCSLAQNRVLDCVIEKLKDLNSITVTLQKEGMTLADTRLFLTLWLSIMESLMIKLAQMSVSFMILILNQVLSKL